MGGARAVASPVAHSGRSVATRTGLLALVRDRLGPAFAGAFGTMGKDSPWPDVQAAAAGAREAGADLLVAVGGGSVIQATRVVAILLAEPGEFLDRAVSARARDHRQYGPVGAVARAGDVAAAVA